MKINITPIITIITMVLSSCTLLSSEADNPETQATQTSAVAKMATALMEEARLELANLQTVTAGVEMAVERALATSVSGAVAETLTAIAPILENTATPFEIPTDTPTVPAMASETPTTDPTATSPPLPTTTAPLICYQVIDDWCNTHQGCSTVDVRNHSGMKSTWHIWSDKSGVDVTLVIPAGHCTLEARPGKYNFFISYCSDEVSDFAWQLNDNWWYKISPCD